MKTVLRLFLSISLHLAVVCTVAASDVNYMVTTRDGLSNSSINTMMLDSKGMLWISTWDGINVYNGKSMKVYRSDPNDPQTLLDNIVWFVIQESERYYWAVTDWGVSRYDAFTGKYSRYRVGAEYANPMTGGRISMDVSESGTVFCASKGWGVAFYDEVADKMMPFNISGLGSSDISGLFCIGDDRLIVNLIDGSVASVHYKKNEDFGIDAYMHQIIIPSESMVYYSVYDDENLFFYGKDTVYRWNKESGEITGAVPFSDIVSFAQPSPEGKLCSVFNRSIVHEVDFESGSVRVVEEMCRNNLLCFHFGPEDMTWLGIDGIGLEVCYVANSSMKKINNIDVYGTRAGSTTAMVQTKDGDIYVSTLGNGIYVLDDEGELKTVLGRGILPDDRIYSMEKGPDDILFLGLSGNIVAYDSSSSRSVVVAELGAIAYCQYYDVSNDILWVGTIGNGVYKLEFAGGTADFGKVRTTHFMHVKGNELSLSSGSVMHIAPCDSSHVWIGTLGGGLNRMDMHTGECSVYRASGAPGDLYNDNVRFIYPEPDGSIWLCTSYGICHGVPSEDGQLSFRTFMDGLQDLTIHAIMKDDMGRLWLSSNSGLSFFDPKTEAFTNYVSSDMLQAEEFYIHSCLKTSSGEMYFGGVAGLNHFFPEKMHLRDNSPNIIIESFTIRLDNHRHVYDGSSVTLDHDENFFNISFSALEYIGNDNCEYAYRLEGFNDDWVTVGGGIAAFTNVPPGNYVFRVRSTNGDKVWCDNEATLDIRIRNPWYLRWWAYLIYATLLSVSSIVILIFYRQRMREKHMYDIEVQEKKAQKDQYEAKLTFFTNVAHEFGTPLTLIACSGEQLLSRIGHNSKDGRYVKIINDNAARMQNLIQELLEFRKVETGYYTPSYGYVDPAAMLKNIMDNFQDAGMRHSIVTKLQMPDSIPDFITDRSALEKIMTNLISNAYKYTPDGGVVDVLLERKDGGIRCVVTNTSKGLSQEKLEHVFDRFVILDTLERQMAKGKMTRNGLGTALVNSLVKTLGGNISVDSVMEKSVTFEFWLPAVTEEQITVREGDIPVSAFAQSSIYTDIDRASDYNTLSEEDNGADKPLVMVVDDDFEVCGLIADLLSHKYRVMKAADGSDALEKVATERPDLIITDMDMPKVDGLELLKRLKSNELTRFVPVVFLAFKTDVDNEVDTFKLGCEAFIHKPFLPQQITAIVDNVIAKRRSLKDYYQSAASEMDLFQGNTMNSKEKEFISSFIRVVEENITDDLSPAIIAQKMCLSEMTLYRRIKDYIGKRPSEFIRGIKLNRAAHLLKTTDRTVQEIMFDCGFNNKSYFYRTFSNTYGKSPKEYRKS